MLQTVGKSQQPLSYILNSIFERQTANVRADLPYSLLFVEEHEHSISGPALCLEDGVISYHNLTVCVIFLSDTLTISSLFFSANKRYYHVTLHRFPAFNLTFYKPSHQKQIFFWLSLSTTWRFFAAIPFHKFISRISFTFQLTFKSRLPYTRS